MSSKLNISSHSLRELLEKLAYDDKFRGHFADNPKAALQAIKIAVPSFPIKINLPSKDSIKKILNNYNCDTDGESCDEDKGGLGLFVFTARVQSGSNC